MDEALRSDSAVVVPADKVALISPLPNCGEEARELYTQVFTTWQETVGLALFICYKLAHAIANQLRNVLSNYKLLWHPFLVGNV